MVLEIQSEYDMYDVHTNTLYYKEKYSKNYYHEYRHYIDHKSPLYKKISIAFEYYSSAVDFVFAIILPLVFLYPQLGFSYFVSKSIYLIFKLQEEVRAEIYGIIHKK